jgi:hypothetical protein
VRRAFLLRFGGLSRGKINGRRLLLVFTRLEIKGKILASARRAEVLFGSRRRHSLTWHLRSHVPDGVHHGDA